MNRTVIFHIGPHRTATTFLQTKFFPGLAGVHLLDHNTLYEEIISLTTTDEIVWQGTDLKDKTIQSIISKLKPGVNLISAEALSGFPFHKSINRSLILSRLKQSFPDAKIIIGIREQRAILKSLYFLYVREGGILRFRDIVKKSQKNDFGYYVYDNMIDTIDLDVFKYDLLFDYAYQLFGENNVIPFVFEHMKNDENYLNHVAKKLGIQNHKYNKVNENKVNTSYPEASINAIRKMNRLTRGFPSKGKVKHIQKRFYNRIVKNVLKGDSTKIMNSDFNIFEYYQSDNQKLAERFPEFSKNFNKYNLK